jgi:hypothetical protein
MPCIHPGVMRVVKGRMAVNVIYYAWLPMGTLSPQLLCERTLLFIFAYIVWVPAG